MSENKEIDECVKKLGACYDEFYKRFCEGKFCTECVLQYGVQDCVLNVLQDVIYAYGGKR